MLANELQRVCVAVAACNDCRFEHDCSALDVHDRECVGVAVRGDTNDVVQLICEHPKTNLQPKRWGTRFHVPPGSATAIIHPAVPNASGWASACRFMAAVILGVRLSRLALIVYLNTEGPKWSVFPTIVKWPSSTCLFAQLTEPKRPS